MADDTTNASNQSTANVANTTSNQAPGGDLEGLLRQSPFGPLLDIDGVNGVEDIFGSIAPPSGGSAFGGSGGASFNENSPYGGNPFAGDNFWNIFAGGVNPSNPSTTGAGGAGGAGGGGFGGGGGGNTGGFPGGGGGGGFPGGGGGNAGGFPGGGGGNAGGFPGGGGGNSSGGSPFPGGGGSAVDPFEGDNFWEIFAGGVNPTEFSSDNLPSQAFVASSQGGATPVPEPSSMIGIAVIGLGIAAGKFKHSQRAKKVSNFKK